MNGTRFDSIEQAISYIERHRLAQPSLAEIADGVGLSPHHLQRLFTAWAGVSPKQFLRHLTLDHARALLGRDSSVLDAAYEVGLSGPGRLHDLMVTLEAATPGEFGAGGRGLDIRFGFLDSLFGRALAGLTDRGICWLAFHGAGEERAALDALAAHWPEAALREDAAGVRKAVGPALARGGAVPGRPLRLWAQGSNFQIKVWDALLRIPPGRLVTYGGLARTVGRAGAARAVGGAAARNPIALLIPCHRVIRASGRFAEGYRWGSARKRAMIAWEASASARGREAA